MKTNIQKMNESMEREGDPDDKSVDHTEEFLILPRIQENKVKLVHCKTEKDALDACRKKYGTALSMVCFFDAMFYGLCVNTQSDSDDIMDDSYDEYLAIRSKYRLTKDPKTLHRLKAMVFPHKYKTDEP